MRPVSRSAAEPGSTSKLSISAGWLVHHLMVRLRHLRQRSPLMTRLAARLAAALPPQRPRLRRRLAQPVLKLSDPLPRPRQLVPRPAHQPACRSRRRPVTHDYRHLTSYAPYSTVISHGNIGWRFRAAYLRKLMTIQRNVG